MADLTTINARVRTYLDAQSLNTVDLGEPVFYNGLWFTLVTFEDRMLGTVVCDENGEVLADLSYPNTRQVDKIP